MSVRLTTSQKDELFELAVMAYQMSLVVDGNLKTIEAFAIQMDKFLANEVDEELWLKIAEAAEARAKKTNEESNDAI